MTNESSKNVITLCEQTIEENLKNNSSEKILNGLFRGNIGFLIAPPDTGKSYLCLSIAYELALQEHRLIGVTQENTEPYKTLLWPIEDGLIGTLPRIKDHISEFSKSVRERLKTHVGIYNQINPICCSANAYNTQEERDSSSALSDLITTAKDYDLVIIDTLRDAIGSANEVKDDYFIRIALEKLAREADVAVLVVHHPTKEISRGKEIVNSVAGSGLSSTLSKSKLHLYLDRSTHKTNEVTETRLRHIKANYLPANERWRKPIVLKWTENSLLYIDSEAIKQLRTDELKNTKSKKHKSIKQKKPRLPDEPELIQRDESLLSEESKRLAEKASLGPFGESMGSELQELKKS